MKQPSGVLILTDPSTEPGDYLDYLRRLSPEDLEGQVADLVADAYGGLLGSAEAVAALAGTNASGWVVDDCEIQDIDLGGGECVVALAFTACGEQEADKENWGDRLSGSAEAVIDRRGGVIYQNVTAEVEGFDGPEGE